MAVRNQNLGALQEQHLLMATEPSLQPQLLFLIIFVTQIRYKRSSKVSHNSWHFWGLNLDGNVAAYPCR